MKIYITSAAKAMRDLESEVVAHIEQIEQHFIKLLIDPTSSARNHWQGEIVNQLQTIRKLKSGKRYPAASKIFKWLYTDQLVDLTDMHRFAGIVFNICDAEGFEMPEDLEALNAQLLAVLKSYYTWLSAKLSLDGFINRREAFKQIDELV